MTCFKSKKFGYSGKIANIAEEVELKDPMKKEKETPFVEKEVEGDLVAYEGNR